MIRAVPLAAPVTIRIDGVIQLFSNAYFTKNTTPRNSARPPIHAKSFTPRIDSQLIASRWGDSGIFGGGGVGGGLRKSGRGGGIVYLGGGGVGARGGL